MALITLSQALKYKKRIGAQMEKTRTKMRNINSYWESEPDFTNIKPILEESDKLMEHLVSLKVKINDANKEIQDKIYLLGELKSKINSYRFISASRTSRVNPNTGEQTYSELQINKKELDDMVDSLQKEINSLQDEIDRFNATKKIEVDLMDV